MEQLPRTMKFGGKVYRFFIGVRTKKEANDIKDKHKKQGYKVRVVNGSKRFGVYGYYVYERR